MAKMIKAMKKANGRKSLQHMPWPCSVTWTQEYIVMSSITHSKSFLERTWPLSLHVSHGILMHSTKDCVVIVPDRAGEGISVFTGPVMECQKKTVWRLVHGLCNLVLQGSPSLTRANIKNLSFLLISHRHNNIHFVNCWRRWRRRRRLLNPRSFIHHFKFL